MKKERGAYEVGKEEKLKKREKKKNFEREGGIEIKCQRER